MNDQSKSKFFHECFLSIQPLRGLHQYEKMKEAKQNDEYKQLLWGMVRVSNSFNYIPWEAQQEIIKTKILIDPDFLRLDASKIWAWLNESSGKYFKQEAHNKPEEANYEAVPFDELSEETKTLVKQFEATLLASPVRQVPAVSQAEIEAIRQEDLERVEHRAVSVGYKSTTPEEFELKQLRAKWMRENVDPLSGSGKLKPGGVDWETFKELMKR